MKRTLWLSPLILAFGLVSTSVAHPEVSGEPPPLLLRGASQGGELAPDHPLGGLRGLLGGGGLGLRFAHLKPGMRR